MSEEFERRANCPMCGAPCTIEGKDGSTRYYAPIVFTREEARAILRLIKRMPTGPFNAIDENVKESICIKCVKLLKGAVE